MRPLLDGNRAYHNFLLFCLRFCNYFLQLPQCPVAQHRLFAHNAIFRAKAINDKDELELPKTIPLIPKWAVYAPFKATSVERNKIVQMVQATISITIVPFCFLDMCYWGMFKNTFSNCITKRVFLLFFEKTEGFSALFLYPIRYENIAPMATRLCNI